MRREQSALVKEIAWFINTVLLLLESGLIIIR